ncbi:unnamed protein product [Ixodes persulcatus]
MASAKPEILRKYLDLEQPDDVVFVTYVFVDGTLENVRAKTRTLDFEPKTAKDCPEWTYCALGTYQWADAGAKSEMFLVPVALFRDPFLKGRNKLVLCETLLHDRRPPETNTRWSCDKAMKEAANEDPWFGIEQEYVLLDADKIPLGWPKDNNVIRPLGKWSMKMISTLIVTKERLHYSGHVQIIQKKVVKLLSIDAKSNWSKWEYQVGPLSGVQAADHLWMSRYILHRVAEEFGVIVSFDPKPFQSNELCGSGGHINFSTRQMRDDGGIEYILEALKKLEVKSELHLTNYDPQKGKSNSRRLNAGMLATPSEDFTADKCSRLSSIRVPRLVVEAGKGYLEDRRPGANVEPYRATETLVKTVCLDA